MGKTTNEAVKAAVEKMQEIVFQLQKEKELETAKTGWLVPGMCIAGTVGIVIGFFIGQGIGR